MKLLIVEDEPELLESLKEFAEKEGYQTDTAATFSKANELVHLYEYDCILLDIGLPDDSGLRLLGELEKQTKKEGVLVISAKDSLDDKVTGLRLGADDYLTKPFHLSELNARINAIVRRKKFNAVQAIHFGGMTIDPDQRKVVYSGEEFHLTRKEFDLLLHLIANTNRVISKNSLTEYLWGDKVDSMDSFDFLFAHIKNIRKKLTERNIPVEIKSIYGIGYQITEL